MGLELKSKMVGNSIEPIYFGRNNLYVERENIISIESYFRILKTEKNLWSCVRKGNVQIAFVR